MRAGYDSAVDPMLSSVSGKIGVFCEQVVSGPSACPSSRGLVNVADKQYTIRVHYQGISMKELIHSV